MSRAIATQALARAGKVERLGALAYRILLPSATYMTRAIPVVADGSPHSSLIEAIRLGLSPSIPIGVVLMLY